MPKPRDTHHLHLQYCRKRQTNRTSLRFSAFVAPRTWGIFLRFTRIDLSYCRYGKINTAWSFARGGVGDACGFRWCDGLIQPRGSCFAGCFPAWGFYGQICMIWLACTACGWTVMWRGYCLGWYKWYANNILWRMESHPYRHACFGCGGLGGFLCMRLSWIALQPLRNILSVMFAKLTPSFENLINEEQSTSASLCSLYSLASV